MEKKFEMESAYWKIAPKYFTMKAIGLTTIALQSQWKHFFTPRRVSGNFNYR